MNDGQLSFQDLSDQLGTRGGLCSTGMETESDASLEVESVALEHAVNYREVRVDVVDLTEGTEGMRPAARKQSQCGMLGSLTVEEWTETDFSCSECDDQVLSEALFTDEESSGKEVTDRPLSRKRQKMQCAAPVYAGLNHSATAGARENE